MRRRKKEFDLKYKIIGLIFGVFFLLIILGMALKDKKELNPVTGFIRDSGLFIIEIFNAPVYYLKDLSVDYNKYITQIDTPGYSKLKAENDDLKVELEALKKENTNYSTDYKSVVGRVVIRNIGTWYNQMTINKGTADGLEYGQAVTNNLGLVGTVSTVSKRYATINLLFNNRERPVVPATVLAEEGSEFGYVQGYDPKDGTLIFNKINDNVTVKLNDKVVTSSFGGKLPIGLLIGDITTIVRDEYGIVSKLKINPAADFENIRYVTVLVKNE